MRRIAWWTVLAGMAVASTGAWTEEALSAATLQAKLSQQVAGGGVTVIATLLKDQPDAMAIKLVLDTHSVSLDEYDLERIATLRDSSGKTYPVKAVEQASGGGHHRQAVLRFGKVAAEAKAIELIVKDVAGVRERIFRWSTTE